MAQAAVVLREKRRRKINQELEEGLHDQSPGIVSHPRRHSYTPSITTQHHLELPNTNTHNITTQVSTNSSSLESLEQLNDDGIYNANNNANVILYVGLGMIAIGLIITFVGLGEKGFQTLELKLIGPSLVGCGIFFALLRILFCTVPSCFNSCAGKCCCVALNKKELEKKKLLDKRLITSAGVESIPRSSLQESAKSRSTPLPPIITAQPSFVRSSYQPSSQKDDTGEEEAPLTSKKPRQGSSARRKTTTEAPRAFQLRSAERRKTAPSSTSSSSKGNRKSLDEFSITDSDLILQEEVSSQVKRKEDPEKGGGGGSPSTSLKNLSHELVLSADGL
ncbi:uncharacterized protein [Lepeophtheirus salmonis]|uniref:uncharacterized protein isoform X5 n=1 Tax=Lepeophtheirus salmonis TaxID=72036 RepID=UPI001AE403F6|nr:uncharacterized protein LOC121120819 isoform X5 [Lepeophtheirus salmonis]